MDVGSLYYFVQEFAQSRLTFQEQDCQAEFHAELGFESRPWLVVEKSGGHVVIRPDVHLLNLRRLYVVRLNQPRELAHRGMSE